MADKRITDLPLIFSGNISSNDVLPIVDVNTDVTNKIEVNELKSYILSGVSDNFVTGGTYSGGTLILNRQNGFVSISGLYTGETSYVNSLTTGTGLSANTTTGNITIINTDPDQIVTISGGTGILTGGTYPNFTIENTLPDQIVTISGGTNVDVTGTYPNFNIALTGLSVDVSLFTLPTPFLKISNQDITLETFNLSTVDLINSPIISTNDLSIEQINHGVWVEMLVYRKKRKRKNTNLYKKGFVIPPDWTWDSILGTGVNSLQQELLTLYPTKTIMNRGGETKNLNQSRPNHYKVTGNTESINLGYYLNGRFTYYNVGYRLLDGSLDYIGLPIPVSRNQQYARGSRFCYQSKLTPTYIKFRYIMFDPDFNGGKGRFVTGPLSSTIKITLEKFPFVPTTPYCGNPFGCSSTELYATCTTKPGTYNKLKCSIESNVP